ncbi:MAG TPA: TonB-dependent receptor [Steroidobacteraceae bacterium]|nr:TonB-dependent receptor [Steroidobacteraceae bacterium]
MIDRARRRSPIAQAISLILGTAVALPAFAQTSEPLEEVVVTGIRGSLTSSMNLKRDGQGVIDGIVAEDIGKFPDTNLAESLQRISGVSIDRSSIGEGQRVTVRGVGPDFNLVLLNGRQMPVSSIQDTVASDSRAFDFANLASEAISAIEVYKTSRASTPTGGIGATINIKTARPLDNPGLHTSLGVKGVIDDSGQNLPDHLKGDEITPEVSGIYSQTFGDDKFGVSLSASYQERNSGFNQAAVGNGWRSFGGDENNWGTIPQPGQPGSERIVNRPDATDTYSVPQNLGYSVNGIERTRTNGQLALQWRPLDALTATLDYTYSENKIETQRNELSVWFNFGPSSSSWTDGPVAGPLVYTELIPGANSDLSMGGAKFASKNENKSLGFNLAWEASDRLGFALDYHDSSAESGADSPYGSNAVLGVASFVRGDTTGDFSQDFPVISVRLPAGQSTIDPAQNTVTGSAFRNGYMKMDIEQAQLSGNFDFTDSSRLDFGVALTEMKNRTAFSTVQNDTWGADVAFDPAVFPDEVWRGDTIRQYFDQISGSGNPNLFNDFFTFDFDTVRNIAAGLRGEDRFSASADFTTDRHVKEESQSAYVQFSQAFDTAMPINVAVGVRYEQTDVTSSALVPSPSGISWASDNELNVIRPVGASTTTTLKGDYDYVLPNLDFNIGLMDNLKFRASWGKTIGRPKWGDIQGGQVLDLLVRVDGGTGSQGNPALKPLESTNIDLSLEWYYAEGSYASVGYFTKDIDNYVGITQITEQPFELHTPIGGALYNEAVAAACADGNTTCIRNWIFDNRADAPGVDAVARTITGQAGDPIADFRITVPANQRSSTLHGWEFNLQHMFGASGFGVSANYTMVDSGLTYPNQLRNEQFALEGLSDAANVVAFYENFGWGVRLAYNWRDEFLSSRFDGAGANPNYTEEYGQFDLNVSYQWGDNLTLQAEAINLTDEIQRIHGRTASEALFVTQTGPRYMIGARYKFGGQ